MLCARACDCEWIDKVSASRELIVQQGKQTTCVETDNIFSNSDAVTEMQGHVWSDWGWVGRTALEV